MTRLSDNERRALVSVYLKEGIKGVTPLAEAKGIKPKTVQTLASRMGRWKRQHDPRWKRAIAVGKVVAGKELPIKEEDL